MEGPTKWRFVSCSSKSHCICVDRALQADKKMISKVFRALDKDGDGFISSEDLRHLMTNKDANDTIKENDINRDGQINYEETLFRSYDKDGNGFISSLEFRHKEKRKYHERYKNIGRIDIDKDGLVNYEEFICTSLFNHFKIPVPNRPACLYPRYPIKQR